MEKLIIKDFASVKYAGIDINRINIVTGPQSSGKSIICKLVYYFKSFINHFGISVIEKETIDKFKLRLSNEFYKIFPQYALENQFFELTYNFNDSLFIKIKNNGNTLLIEYSDGIGDVFKKLKEKYILKTLDEKESMKQILAKEVHIFFQAFDYPVFIPASRSFWVNMQKNIWTFISQDIPIDFLLKDFGTRYEKNKVEYEMIFSLDIYDELFSDIKKIKKDRKTVIKKISKLAKEILKGDYRYMKDEDRLYSGERYIKLPDSSSSQQEVFPLIATVATLTVNHDRNECPYFFIEEPESHLSPCSQKQLIELFSLLFNSIYPNTGFFISTHSPYIIDGFNDLIMPPKDSGGTKANNLNKLQFNDISIYCIQSGMVKDIRDYENRRIDYNDIG